MTLVIVREKGERRKSKKIFDTNELFNRGLDFE